VTVSPSPPSPQPASRWAYRIATTFGLGDRLPAPGTTAGSLPAALLWWGLWLAAPNPAVGHLLTVLSVAATTVVAVWACDVEALRRGSGDPRPVVIDEVAGQLLTFLVALPFLLLDTLRQQAVAVGVGFVLFRFFDVVKPWPVGRLERVPGGLGILADDVAAGVYAGLVLAVASRWLG
jgi:phosphatidylglycerophosphatase A